jgi:hypothetical protein
VFVLVDEDVLGFDVAVGDGQHAQVVEGAEDLVDVEFGEQGRDLFLFYQLVEVVREVVHYDVEVLLIALVGEEGVFHEEVVGVFQHFQDGVLPVFVLLVLEYFFYCDFLADRAIHAEVHYSEGALAGYPFDFVLGGGRFGALGEGEGGGEFGALVCFGFEVFVGGEGFGLCEFIVFFGLDVVVSDHIFGVDVDEFGFCGDSLCFFEWVL